MNARHSIHLRDRAEAAFRPASPHEVRTGRRPPPDMPMRPVHDAFLPDWLGGTATVRDMAWALHKGCRTLEERAHMWSEIERILPHRKDHVARSYAMLWASECATCKPIEELVARVNNTVPTTLKPAVLDMALVVWKMGQA